MSREAWSYVDGSAGQQHTARANREAFDRHRIVPRMLVDVEERDTSVELFGRRLPAPLLFAPIGVLEMAHREAERAVAEAARALGLPMVISTQGSLPMEETAAALGDSPRWYQLYWSKDDDVVDSFVSRAEAIGSEAIVVTLDTHVLGWRTRDLDVAYLPFARAEGIAQYTSDPAFRRLVRERAATPSARSPRRGPRSAASSALVSMARHYPGRPAGNLRSPLPRAAVETFLDVFSRSVADLGGPREPARAHLAADRAQGHPGPPRRRARLDARRRRHRGVQPRRPPGRRRDRVAGRAAGGRRGGRRPGSGAVRQRGPQRGRRVQGARARRGAVLVGRPWVYGLALAGADGARAVMEHVWAELT